MMTNDNELQGPRDESIYIANIKEYIDEIKASRKDIWAIASGIAAFVGYVSLIGYQPKTTFLREAIHYLQYWVNQISSAIFSTIGVELSIFASSLLFWFFIVSGIYYRAGYLELRRIDIREWRSGFNATSCLLLLIGGPFILFAEAKFPEEFGVSWIILSLCSYFIIMCFACFAVIKFRLFDIFILKDEKYYGPLISFASILILAVVASTLVTGPELTFLEPADERPPSIAIVLVLFLCFLSVVIYISMIAFLFNLLLAFSYPRAVGGAIIAGVALWVGDSILPFVVPRA